MQRERGRLFQLWEANRHRMSWQPLTLNVSRICILAQLSVRNLIRINRDYFYCVQVPWMLDEKAGCQCERLFMFATYLCSIAPSLDISGILYESTAVGFCTLLEKIDEGHLCTLVCCRIIGRLLLTWIGSIYIPQRHSRSPYSKMAFLTVGPFSYTNKRERLNI